LDAPAVVIGLPTFESVARSPVRVAVDCTANGEIGDDVPTPTRPLEETLNHAVPDDEATVKIFEVSPA
jgi:hypothetical protein